MFAQANYPSTPIRPEELDAYLAKGWFRLGQTIFTCAYLQLNEEIYRTFWLRIVLEQFESDQTLKKLSKLNAKFYIKIQPVEITPEKEALYNSYKTGIAFDPSESLQTILYHHPESNIYHTLEIDIYDGSKLIGVGFFDIGKNSAAGITAFYDPAYKKHSLGKYLIYQKLLYCKNLQLEYFYLGYFAPGCKAFDYKLSIAKSALEYFDIRSEAWIPMSAWNPVSTSIQESRQKLLELQQHFYNLDIISHLVPYHFSQANLMRELHGFNLFDYIHLIYFFDFDPTRINPVVVYDIRDSQYHLLNCYSIGMPEDLMDHQRNFSAQILKIQEIIYATSNAEEMVEVLPRVLLIANGGWRQ